MARFDVSLRVLSISYLIRFLQNHKVYAFQNKNKTKEKNMDEIRVKLKMKPE